MADGVSRRWIIVGVLAIALPLLVGLGLLLMPGPARPDLGPLGLQVPVTRIAEIAQEVEGHDGPGGAGLGWTLGGPYDHAKTVVILGDSVAAAGTEWVRVYVLPVRAVGGGDMFTWIPLAVLGERTLDQIRLVDCPASRDNIGTIAALDPVARIRCLGTESFTVPGVAGEQLVPSGYTVTPEWFDGWNGQVSQPFSIRNDEPGLEFFDVVQPPGIAAPPRAFTIALTAHVADPRSVDCERTPIDGDPRPAEAKIDSVLWCATRVVAETWTIELGPEGRPIDPAHPQLHRSKQPSTACAGVNGGVMRFRLDAAAVDPVWLEGEGGYRQIPVFAPGFEPAFLPDFVIVDAAGNVIARDGDVIDTNRSLHGHQVCPTGNGVVIG